MALPAARYPKGVHSLNSLNSHRFNGLCVSSSSVE